MPTNDPKRKDLILQLFDRYGHVVYGFALRAVSSPVLAADITIEVFMSFDNSPALPELNELIAKTRFFTVAALRNGSVERMKEAETFDFYTFQKKSSEAGAQLHQMLNDTRSAMEPKCKTILEMAYFNGFTQQEIETALNLPDGSTAMRLRRALNDLRRVFSLK